MSPDVESLFVESGTQSEAELKGKSSAPDSSLDRAGLESLGVRADRLMGSFSLLEGSMTSL